MVQAKPWPELQELLPPLSRAEREGLRKSIAEQGVLVSILTLPDGRIIDGHHRWELSGGEATVEVKDIGEDEGLILGLVLNLARRQLSPEQVREVHKGLQRNKELQKAAALELRQQGKTQEEAAALVGVDRSTISLWQKEDSDKEDISNVNSHNAYILTSSIPDQRVSVPRQEYEKIHQRYRAGESQEQIAADYSITQPRVSQIVELVEARSREVEAVKEDVPFPDRRYRCLVIDPPWPTEKVEREDRPKQGQKLDYPTISLEDIAGLPIADLAIKDGCHVYLWVTHRFLPEGLKLFEQWGVKYQCMMTWVKPTGITPFSWMYNTEHVLFGRIGSLALEQNGLKLSFSAPVTKHSEKPDVFYERVIAASPEPRLDMFARKPREGFDVWGNEVEGVD